MANTNGLKKDLVSALYKLDVENARKIIERNPPLLRNKEKDGWLWIVAKKGGVDFVEFLLDLGCDPNGKSAVGDPVISEPISGANIEVLRLLLKRGADPRIHEDSRRNLICAINAPRHELEMVKLLEDYGLDLHMAYKNEMTSGLFNALSHAIERGKSSVADYLRSKGVTVPGEAKDTMPGDEVFEFFRRHFGSPNKQALIEIVPTGQPPIAVHVIPPSSGHDCVTIFTTGMASEPMRVPKGREAFQFAELFMQLPAAWKWDQIDDLKHAWPLLWLRKAAQNPHENQSYLGGPVCILSNDDPPQPFAPNTKFTCLLLLAEKEVTRKDAKTVKLYRAAPLYTEERDLEKRQGIAALLQAFDREGIPFIVNTKRKNVGFKEKS